LKAFTGRLAGVLGGVVTIGILCLLGLPAFGQQKPIRIGATVSLEGSYTELSFMVRNGYELWAKEVNERGGLLGRKVELLFYDDHSRKDLVGPLYEKLITQDKVDMVLAPYGSPLTMSASEVTEKYGYVLMAAAASAKGIWERGYSYVFGVYSTADRYFIGFLDLAARHKLTRVAVINNNTSFHIAAAEGVRKWAGLFGMQIVFSASYDNPDKELPDIVNRLQSTDPQDLIFCGYPPDCYSFLKLLHKAGIRPPGLAMTIAPALPDFYTTAGPIAEGVFGPSQWEADKRLPFPGTLHFIENFSAMTGKEPSYHACSAYSACQILEKAIEQAGSINQKKIRNFVAGLDTVTIMGRFKVDSMGRQIGHNPLLIQWQGGKKEIVYPTKMQTAAAIFHPEPKNQR
jgi:branched-chain amino acid transport system substrate-binding protein